MTQRQRGASRFEWALARCVCYLKLLREVVHFYNTLDALPRCQIGDPGEKVLAGRPPSIQRQ
jgi:hypothetical protein